MLAWYTVFHGRLGNGPCVVYASPGRWSVRECVVLTASSGVVVVGIMVVGRVSCLSITENVT